MQDTFPLEQQNLRAEELRSEIEKLRSQFQNTQDLYREVCALLFFRYGVTPTANKLYQLVRKGSMSAPAEALCQFWKILREKSRTRIEHPDLPPVLSEMAGELIGTLWQRAQTLAHESLDAVREEIKKSALEAQASAEAATCQAELAQKSLEATQVQLLTCEERLQKVQHLLAKEEGEKLAIRRQLEGEIAQSQQIQNALNSTQKELECQRAAVTALDERYQASLSHVHLEIERERAHLAKAQEDLERSKRAALEQRREAQNVLQAARQEFTAELENQRQILATLERRFHEDLQRAHQDIDHERAHLMRVREELAQTRAQAAEQASRDHATLNALRQESAKLNQKFGELEGALTEARSAKRSRLKPITGRSKRGRR
ncbi:MAG: hypothetical protein C5B47_02785 [Verrucomicrobia bacterium]|nr:MAG: hypothetical protein C5B47_02785 [Verrucomicrobiota bacterium]